MDNLQGVTYEVFERDPVKYERYEEVRVPAPVPLIYVHLVFRQSSKLSAIDLKMTERESYLLCNNYHQLLTSSIGSLLWLVLGEVALSVAAW